MRSYDLNAIGKLVRYLPDPMQTGRVISVRADGMYDVKIDGTNGFVVTVAADDLEVANA